VSWQNIFLSIKYLERTPTETSIILLLSSEKINSANFELGKRKFTPLYAAQKGVSNVIVVVMARWIKAKRNFVVYRPQRMIL